MRGEKEVIEGESGNVTLIPEGDAASVGTATDDTPVAGSDERDSVPEMSVPPVTHDLIFETLQNRRRRCVLHYLKRNGGTAPVGTMAQTIAAWEEASPVTAVSSKARKRVYTSLYQVHLPNMATDGFLTYDQGQGVVSLKPRAAELTAYLETDGSGNIPWSLFYLGLSAVFAAVTALNALVASPLLIVSDGIWSLVFATVFLVISAVHAYRGRATSIWRGDRPEEMRK